MKILWLTNIVIPELCEVFGFKPQVFGGWIIGMWNQMKLLNDVSLGICVPIIDKVNMRDGELFGYNYYSFEMFYDYDHIEIQKKRFKTIIKEFEPDLIHIWGTEYSHSTAMVDVCEELNLLDKVLVNIQGLVSYCSKHYAYGLTSDQINCSRYEKNIADEMVAFERKGIYEKSLLEKVTHVSGRTSWDYMCVRLINPNIEYYYCKEILRDIFYQSQGNWSYDKCEKNTIFISQASYAVKGLHNIIEILARVKLQIRDLKVYIGGVDLYKVESAYSDIIKSLIEQFGLKENICFVGFLDEYKMIDYYEKVNIFLSVSNIENSSNSVCEALRVGTPIISTYVGGIPSLLTHNENGLLYALDEKYLLERYILDLFSDENLCSRLSENGKNRVKDEYPNEIVITMCDIYKKIIGR